MSTHIGLLTTQTSLPVKQFCYVIIKFVSTTDSLLNDYFILIAAMFLIQLSEYKYLVTMSIDYSNYPRKKTVWFISFTYVAIS